MREPVNKTLSYPAQSLFNTPKNVNSRRCTFGLSGRGDIFVSKETKVKPSPQNYSLNSQFTPRDYAFERPKSSSRSLVRRSHDTSFGVSRQAFDKVVGHDGTNHQPHDRN